MISTVQERFLISLYDLHYLIVRQFAVHLNYKAGSYTTITSHLKSLTTDGYIQTTALRWNAYYGRPALVYLLARRGLNYLREVHGLFDGRRFHPSEEREHNPLFLKHTIEVNDFLISAYKLEKANPDIAIRECIHERSMKNRKLVVEDRDGLGDKSKERAGRKISAMFDGWIDFRIQTAESKTVSLPVALELDRGTENQTIFRQKCRAILLGYKTAYPELFGSPHLTLAVVTTHSDRRRVELLRWIEAELADLEETHQADLFRVVYCQPRLLPPEELFFSPVWNRPGDLAKCSLLGT